jgi:uncharacterized protein
VVGEQASAPARKPGKGQRPKHVPQRMCVSCRERSAKRTLIRIVRGPDGAVDIDPTGRRNGRGAYLCDDPACWTRAVANGQLARALKVEFTPDTIDMLRHYGDSLPPATAAEPDPESHEGGNP